MLTFVRVAPAYRAIAWLAPVAVAALALMYYPYPTIGTHLLTVVGIIPFAALYLFLMISLLGFFGSLTASPPKSVWAVAAKYCAFASAVVVIKIVAIPEYVASFFLGISLVAAWLFIVVDSIMSLGNWNRKPVRAVKTLGNHG